MRNLLLFLRFDGTAYHGWQVQPNAPTIQQTLQDALSRILRERPPVKGCSRTDSGVHAWLYTCNFRTENAISAHNLVRALNTVLPDDIAVLACREVSADFHARYCAVGKEYVYRILNTPVPDPFLRSRSYFYPYPLDTGRLSELAAAFIGKHDFSSFRAARAKEGGAVRTMSRSDIRREGPLVLLTFRSDGFLYHMVRIMVGTLLFASRRGRDASDIALILSAKDRQAAGPTAPACGLYLNRVFYREEDLSLLEDLLARDFQI